MRHGQGASGQLLQKAVVQGPSGTAVVAHIGVPCNAILCSVKQGSVDLFFGAFGKDVGSAPDLHFGQSNTPVWLPIPCGQFEFTLIAAGPGTTVATVWFGGIS